MFFTNISLKRPVLAFVVIIALIALGITGFSGLAINSMPEVEIPVSVVTITLPGASPDQVESKVTKKVEEALGQISGVKHMTSTISEGYSMTVVEFNTEKSIDVAAQDVRTKIDGIRGSLPDGITAPVITKFDINAMAILSLAVTGNQSSREMSQLVDDKITQRLNAISGVGSVTTYGKQDREIQIKLDKEKLAAFNLTTAEVLNSLRSDNIDTPSGKVTDTSREITLRTYDSIKNADDFKDVLVVTRNGTEIRVGDIAEVSDGFKERRSLSYYNGKECIGIDIVKQSGSNTVSVADNIKKELSKLQAELPAGVKIDIVNDNSTSIRDSVKNVEETMLEGCLLAVFIVFLFLRGAASTLISAISLPTSIITTFAALKFMNFTLNNMTLMALSLAVGLLIDDSIVVIENIIRHLHMGKSPLQAARDGTSEISLAVMATTFTVVAIFVPMAMMGGMIGKFFKEFGLTVAFSVIVSLFVSFTLVPLLSSRYVKNNSEIKGRVGSFLNGFNRLFDRLAIYYQGLLGKVLNNRKKTLAIVLLLFILSLAVIPQMGTSFQPVQDNGKLNIQIALDSGLSLDIAKQKAKTIEEIINKYSEVRNIYTTVKTDNILLSVTLTDKQQRKLSAVQIGDEMRQDLKKIPGIDISIVGASNSMSSGKNYTIHIQGSDFNQLLAYSQKAKQIMSGVPGAVDVGLSYRAGKPEAKMVVDRDMAADLGVSPATIASTLNTLFSGTVVGQYETGNDRFDVRALLEDAQRKNLDSFDGIFVPSSNPGAGMIPLEQLTQKIYTTSSSTINRYDKSREIQLQANYVGISSGELNTAFLKKLNSELKLPKGITLSAGGDQESMQESAGSMIQAVLLGILFIFLILAAQFESFIDPLAIMFSIPLAIIGALLALYITGSGLSIVGGIGIIFLLGLVTKNAILLVDFIKQRRQQGIDRKEAILEAGLIRMRPIMMTTLSMIFGMMPSALAFSTGSEMRQPMAFAIIGGLISATLLTLLVVPVMYTILDDLKNRFSKKQTPQLDAALNDASQL